MIFVKTYAQVSLFIVALIVAYCVVGLMNGHANSTLELATTVISTLWLVFSVVALFVFPSFNARLAAPLLFIGYCLLNLFLTMAIGMAFKGHSASWLVSLRQSPAPLYWAKLIFAVIWGVLNGLLWLKINGHARPPRKLEGV